MKVKKGVWALYFLLSLNFHLFAQLGGLNTFEFLNLPVSARISGLGGNLITVRDADANLGFSNPALLNPLSHGQISFNHSFFPNQIGFGNFGYSHTSQKLGTSFLGGIQYINYGDIVKYDEYGIDLGTGKAAEYAISIGAGKQVDERLAIGVTGKLVSSNLAGFNAIGFLADVAGLYFDTASNFAFTVVVRNFGTQIQTFREGNKEPLPFEVQLGLSKRLKYLPFRFSIIYHHLNRWNVSFDDPNSEEPILFFGETPTEKSPTSIWLDNFFRHFIFSGEFLFGKAENFRLRFGYNHQLRKELSLVNYGSFAGFSLGAGIKINRFKIDFGRTTYHVGGGNTHLGITTYLREFK